MRNDSFEYKGTDKEAELQNHLEEAYLRLMMQKYMEQYGEELLEEEKNLPDGVPKQPTEAQIQQLKDKLAQAAQKSAPPKRRRIAKRLIPVAAVLIALFLATLANAGARSKFFNFFNIHGNVSTEYRSLEEDEQEYLFEYLPNGFSQCLYEVSDDTIRIYYINMYDKEEYILLNISQNGQLILSDAEEESQSSIAVKINNQTGELSEKDGLYSLVWVDPSTASTYLLQSGISKDELIKVAQGISKK
ncbi:DUF4367 domain-containing protein [Agathobaculum sp. NSJ-28]|uniref:DUF4367 domain-containing protein n=1 Tax=Agathobaculum faecis TaxID=2763013 RepID=A0A923LWP0_9FIRM|nr:DUF4367 domain-containing protein [Agathobaculum faecis]MBC5726078.1 DUF4367 domain-containing protein [Agathobaculum faecis]